MYWQKDIVFLFEYVLLYAFSDYDHSGKVDQYEKCYKMICNMSIFDGVDFSSFNACAIIKERLEPSFLTLETWDIFCGGSRHPREAICKVSALLYFFPTKNVIHLYYWPQNWVWEFNCSLTFWMCSVHFCIKYSFETNELSNFQRPDPFLSLLKCRKEQKRADDQLTWRLRFLNF